MLLAVVMFHEDFFPLFKDVSELLSWPTRHKLDLYLVRTG